MTLSMFDGLSDALSPVLRSLKNVNIKLLGTETQILRLNTKNTHDIMGLKNYSYKDDVVNNVLIDYPLSKIEIFNFVKGQTAATGALNLFELLPVKMQVLFADDNTHTDYVKDPIVISYNDIIVHVLRDEYNNKIPVIMQVTRLLGDFNGKNIVGKQYELSLYRGQVEPITKQIINSYLDSLANEKINS